MKYLIWSIINLAFIIFFVYLLIGFISKGKTIFIPKIKIISIIVLIFGTLQIISCFENEENDNRIIITEDYNEKNHSEIEKIILDESLSYNINLFLKYSVSKGVFIPIECNSSITGFVSGFDWKLNSFQIKNYKTEKYLAKGILEWNLFGFNIYNETKVYSGFINIQKKQQF